MNTKYSEYLSKKQANYNKRIANYQKREPLHVEFGDPNFNTATPQIWLDSWRGKNRTMVYSGKCVCCGRKTYEFLDGENDPRGVLGDHANCNLIAEDYSMQGPDVVCCFLCQNNDERTYNYALNLAKKCWQPKEG